LGLIGAPDPINLGMAEFNNIINIINIIIVSIINNFEKNIITIEKKYI
jgi:hypothetical protein